MERMSCRYENNSTAVIAVGTFLVPVCVNIGQNASPPHTLQCVQVHTDEDSSGSQYTDCIISRSVLSCCNFLQKPVNEYYVHNIFFTKTLFPSSPNRAVTANLFMVQRIIDAYKLFHTIRFSLHSFLPLHAILNLVLWS